MKRRRDVEVSSRSTQQAQRRINAVKRVLSTDCQSVQLRAERKGNGNGRVYVVTLKVSDTGGNVSTVTARVSVPNSQSGTVAIDDGPSFTILSNCPWRCEC